MQIPQGVALKENRNQTIQTKTASPRLHPCEYKTTTKLLLANVEEWPQEWQLEVQVQKHPANDSHILFVMLFAQQQLNHLCKQGLLVFIKHLHVVWKLVEIFFVHGSGNHVLCSTESKRPTCSSIHVYGHPRAQARTTPHFLSQIDLREHELKAT